MLSIIGRFRRSLSSKASAARKAAPRPKLKLKAKAKAGGKAGATAKLGDTTRVPWARSQS